MPYGKPIPDLIEFQKRLIGTWKNVDLPNANIGGEERPLSYNVMPLPQRQSQGTQPFPGYILRNFSYYETIRFNSDSAIALPAAAPNRGGEATQIADAVFYDQQVRFAETHPAAGSVVHVENGTWLYLHRFKQNLGPNPTAGNDPEPPERQQPFDLTVAKQIAVPHGNSILALGSFETRDRKAIIEGAPVIPDAPLPYPTPAGLDVTPYNTQLDQSGNYQNPYPVRAQRPNQPLQEAVHLIQPESFIHWRVTTQPLPHGQGKVVNIPFEQQLANVTDYVADYWMLFKGNARYLAYTQTMFMEMKIFADNTERQYLFPHVTCNTVTWTG